MSMERWKPIGDFTGHYEISDQGSARGVKRSARTENQWGESSRRVPAKILRPFPHRGCMRVALCRDGSQCKRGVAVLVLEAFVGPRPRGCYAEHINGDRTDCRFSNLRWVKRDWHAWTRRADTP